MKERLCILGFGAALYSLIEILWRGFTHWTMALTGGLCFLCLYKIQRKVPHTSLFQRCLLGVSVITVIEFTVGCIVNLRLRWNVWDYSGRPLNLLGQICPLFFFLWYLLCIPGFLCCRLLNRHFRENNFE